MTRSIADEQTRLLAYRACFGSPEGKLVLSDLVDRFLHQDSRMHVAANNQLGVAFIDGQRSLIAAIQKWLTCDMKQHLAKYEAPSQEADPYAGQSAE